MRVCNYFNMRRLTKRVIERGEDTVEVEPPADFGVGPLSAAASGPGDRSFCHLTSCLPLLPPACSGHRADVWAPAPPAFPHSQEGPRRPAPFPARTAGVRRRTPVSRLSVPRRLLQVMPSPRSSASGRERTAVCTEASAPRGHTRAAGGGPAPPARRQLLGGPRSRPGDPRGSVLGFGVRVELGAWGRAAGDASCHLCCYCAMLLRVPDSPLRPPACPLLCAPRCRGDRLSLGPPPPAGDVTASCLCCLSPSAP